MNDIVLINGSPSASSSTSMYLLSILKNQIGADSHATIIEVCKSILQNGQSEDFKHMAKADSIVIVFPLYIYCMPGMLTEFLDDYRRFLSETGKSVNQKVYAVINCGFPESSINAEAACVIRRFCEEIKAEYRFSIMIGEGGMLIPAKNAPFMKKTWGGIKDAFDKIIKDIIDGGATQDIFIDTKFPKKLYCFIAATSLAISARKNGLKKKDLYRKIYRPE